MVKDQLINAGYQTILESNQQTNPTCDLVAYATGPNGIAMGTAVEIKNNSNPNLELEAANLHLARLRAGVPNALLITETQIYDLAEEGTTFTLVDQIPGVVPDSAPLASQDFLKNFIWQFANERRGILEPGRMLPSLLDAIEAEDGVISLPGHEIKVDGAAFREFFSSKAPDYKSRDSEGQSSRDTQLVLSSLASLFHSTASIFDPFFGLGLSSYAAADSLRGSVGISNVTGIEINPSIHEKAKKLGRTVRGLRDLDLRLGSSIEQEWPASDLLLTEPPLGLRLPSPISLGGVTVRDFETYTVLRAALEVCEAESRKAAVILTSRSWLSRDRDQALRDKLLDIGAVKAILGLPGIKSNTSIPLAAIVITRGNSKAIVGELLEDWREQLTGEIGGLRDLLIV
jgi:hypothetical protein